MNIYPAIDLMEGKVVRLKRGDYSQKTVYAEHPELTATQFEEAGAQWLHIVDLEGAKEGFQKNKPSVQKILQAVGCKIQFGGGLRSLEQIQEMLDLGVTRVVLGTKALDQAFFEAALKQYGERIAVGLDVRGGVVQTQGWLKAGGWSLQGALKHFNQYPLKTIIYTDIHKDGMLEGPNFESLKEVLTLSKSDIILSGGVTALKDIEDCLKLKATNLEGAIIGKAIYDEKISLRDVISLVQPSRKGA